MNAGRIAIFLSIILSIWGAMHGYVFWRLGSVPWLARHLSRPVLWTIAACLFASYPVARVVSARSHGTVAAVLEFAAANWIGALFLLLSCFLALDVFTLGGRLLPRLAPQLRTGAALIGLLLSIIALVQGLRPPVVRNYDVTLPGLPPERDGMVLVQISDLHLGSVIGPRWTERLVRQVANLKPDLLVVTGDVIDGSLPNVQAALPILQQLKAPLGVWAVTGNHEFYAGLEQSVKFLEDAGFSVLRDRSALVSPGLVLGGVDDLTARAEFGDRSRALDKALANRAPGATILLSHTPWQADTARRHGVGLMLCGHTHNGQIWPFNYLVSLRYAFMGGRYELDGMPVIVSRGTGTWGPRMRLWWPAEIVRLILHSA